MHARPRLGDRVAARRGRRGAQTRVRLVAAEAAQLRKVDCLLARTTGVGDELRTPLPPSPSRRSTASSRARARAGPRAARHRLRVGRVRSARPSARCDVVGITLSREQKAFAEARVAERGLKGRVTFELVDYRDFAREPRNFGRFDRVVSCEMIEAVGHAFLGTFFGAVERVLKRDGGVFVMEAITTPEQRYAEYRRGTDFINSVVFPGSCCPSLAALLEAMSTSSDLSLEGYLNIATHYAATLAEWRRRARRPASRARASIDFDARFRRCWDYYLSYCEAGFATQTLGCLILTFAPGRRRCSAAGRAAARRRRCARRDDGGRRGRQGGAAAVAGAREADGGESCYGPSTPRAATPWSRHHRRSDRARVVRATRAPESHFRHPHPPPPLPLCNPSRWLQADCPPRRTTTRLAPARAPRHPRARKHRTTRPPPPPCGATHGRNETTRPPWGNPTRSRCARRARAPTLRSAKAVMARRRARRRPFAPSGCGWKTAPLSHSRSASTWMST